MRKKRYAAGHGKLVSADMRISEAAGHLKKAIKLLRQARRHNRQLGKSMKG